MKVVGEALTPLRRALRGTALTRHVVLTALAP
jgi:hypothetical protein